MHFSNTRHTHQCTSCVYRITSPIALCPAGQMMERHAGVLGLAALVGSCPYSVPDWLPGVLEELAGHLHDPAPIPV